MIETIKSIILDFQEVPLETGVPRRLKVETVPGKATVLMGVRISRKRFFMAGPGAVMKSTLWYSSKTVRYG